MLSFNTLVCILKWNYYNFIPFILHWVTLFPGISVTAYTSHTCSEKTTFNANGVVFSFTAIKIPVIIRHFGLVCSCLPDCSWSTRLFRNQMRRTTNVFSKVPCSTGKTLLHRFSFKPCAPHWLFFFSCCFLSHLPPNLSVTMSCIFSGCLFSLFLCVRTIRGVKWLNSCVSFMYVYCPLTDWGEFECAFL